MANMTLIRRQDSLEGDRIMLRVLVEDDASEVYVSWLADPEVHAHMVARATTIEALRAYIRQKDESPEALLFGIFWKENGRHIGNVKLEPISFNIKIAVLGLLVGDKHYWRRGVGTEAVRLATTFAFDVLGMQSVELGVDAKNTAAVRVYEKCGFAVDHVEKNRVNPDGILYDDFWMKKTAFPLTRA